MGRTWHREQMSCSVGRWQWDENMSFGWCVKQHYDITECFKVTDLNLGTDSTWFALHERVKSSSCMFQFIPNWLWHDVLGLFCCHLSSGGSGHWCNVFHLIMEQSTPFHSKFWNLCQTWKRLVEPGQLSSFWLSNKRMTGSQFKIWRGGKQKIDESSDSYSVT